MAKKCGFFDCNNPAEKGKNNCQTCQDRKENETCSACRQKQLGAQVSFIYQESLFKVKKKYQFASKLRDKVPAQFRVQIDQVLLQLKLNQDEEKLIEEIEKTIKDYLIEKGGKQDNLFYFRFCSVCNQELASRIDYHFESNPQLGENLTKKIGGEVFLPIYQEIEQEVGKERLKEIIEEINEEIFGKVQDNKGPTNDNSAEIARLQQKVIQLQNEIRNLENNNPTPNSPNSNDEELERNKQELEEVKRKLAELSRNNSPGSPVKTPENPKLPLYFSLAVIGIIVVVALGFFLISAKKQKKKKNELRY